MNNVQVMKYNRESSYKAFILANPQMSCADIVKVLKCHPNYPYIVRWHINAKSEKRKYTKRVVVSNPASSFSFLSDIMGLASKAGGMERLNEIIEPLSEVSEQVGGIGELKKMIGALVNFKAA